MNLNKILNNSTAGKVAYIWHIERVQIDAIKFERTQIHFLPTFSLPSSSSLLKVSNYNSRPRHADLTLLISDVLSHINSRISGARRTAAETSVQGTVATVWAIRLCVCVASGEVNLLRVPTNPFMTPRSGSLRDLFLMAFVNHTCHLNFRFSDINCKLI